MAPVPLKCVLSVSSEDKLNPASNLLRAGSGRKWLTAPQDRSRKAEVVVELCKKARINSIEICNFGSAFIEIHVSSIAASRVSNPSSGSSYSSGSSTSSSSSSGSSTSSSASSGSSPSSEEWLTLLPSCMLMTVADSRGGRNKTTSLTSSHDRFSATSANRKWNRFKIICRQPYNLTSQFGLQYVAFYSDTSTLVPVVPPLPSPSSHSSSSLPSPSPSSHPHNQHTVTGYKLPSLPTSSSTPCKPGEPNSTSKTPQRKSIKKPPLTETDEGNRDFSGVEKQSRLLKNALKTSKEGVELLSPVMMRARLDYDEEWRKGLEDVFTKKHRLNQELSRAERKSDYAVSYDKPKSSEMTAAFRKISRFDDKSEIGQEECKSPWSQMSRKRGGGRGRGRGRGRRRRKSAAEEDVEEEEEAVWVTRRRKKLKGMIQDCQRVLSLAGDAGGTSGRPEDMASTTAEVDTTTEKPSTTAGADSDTDSDATIIMDDPSSMMPPNDPLSPPGTSPPSADNDLLLLPLQSTETNDKCSPASVACPLCGQCFPAYAIELHAANCG